MGLDAPALLLRLIYSWGTSAELFGFASDDLFLLAGAIVVWYFTGRFLDRRSGRPVRGSGSKTRVVRSLPLFALGVTLFFGSLQMLRYPAGSYTASISSGCFMLLWPAALTIPLANALLGVARRPAAGQA